MRTLIVLTVYASLLFMVTAIDALLYQLPFMTALGLIIDVKLGIGKPYVLIASATALLTASVGDYRNRHAKHKEEPAS